MMMSINIPAVWCLQILLVEELLLRVLRKSDSVLAVGGTAVVVGTVKVEDMVMVVGMMEVDKTAMGMPVVGMMVAGKMGAGMMEADKMVVDRMVVGMTGAGRMDTDTMVEDSIRWPGPGSIR